MKTLTKTKNQKFKEGEIVYYNHEVLEHENYLAQITTIDDEIFVIMDFLAGDEPIVADKSNLFKITGEKREIIKEYQNHHFDSKKFIDMVNELKQGITPSQGDEINIDIFNYAILFSERFKKGFIGTKDSCYTTLLASSYNWTAKLQTIDKVKDVLYEFKIYSSEYSQTFIDELNYSKLEKLKCPECGSEEFEKTKIKDTIINTFNQVENNKYQEGKTTTNLTCLNCNTVYTQKDFKKLH